MREAEKHFCKLAFTNKFKLIDQLAAHTAIYDSCLKKAAFIGSRLADAAISDEAERKTFTYQECFENFQDTPWDPLERYLDNVTMGTFDLRHSMPYQALSSERFENPEAIERLEDCLGRLRETLRAYNIGDKENALKGIPGTAEKWTEATWLEYVQAFVFAEKPKKYGSAE